MRAGAFVGVGHCQCDTDRGVEVTDAERKEYDKLLQRVDRYGKGLTEWEINFVAGLIDNPPATPSARQVEILKRIDKEKVG
jgi:hypothetical protein